MFFLLLGIVRLQFFLYMLPIFFVFKVCNLYNTLSLQTVSFCPSNVLYNGILMQFPL